MSYHQFNYTITEVSLREDRFQKAFPFGAKVIHWIQRRLTRSPEVDFSSLGSPRAVEPMQWLYAEISCLSCHNLLRESGFKYDEIRHPAFNQIETDIHCGCGAVMIVRAALESSYQVEQLQTPNE